MIDLKGRIATLAGRQQRCPTGVVGRLIGERMAWQHLPETLWTVSVLDVARTDRVLDIGCGAGRAIELVAARVPDGHVCGIDLSHAMVRAAAPQRMGDQVGPRGGAAGRCGGSALRGPLLR